MPRNINARSLVSSIRLPSLTVLSTKENCCSAHAMRRTHHFLGRRQIQSTCLGSHPDRTRYLCRVFSQACLFGWRLHFRHLLHFWSRRLSSSLVVLGSGMVKTWVEIPPPPCCCLWEIPAKRISTSSRVNRLASFHSHSTQVSKTTGVVPCSVQRFEP